MSNQLKVGDKVLADVQGVPNTACEVASTPDGNTVKVFVPDAGDGFYTYVRLGTIRVAGAIPKPTGKLPKAAKPAKPAAVRNSAKKG